MAMEMAKEICKKYKGCFPCPSCLSYETRFDFFNNKSIWQGRFKCGEAKGTKKGFKREQAKKRKQNLKKGRSITHHFPPMGKIRDMSYKKFVRNCPELGMEQKALALSLLAKMESEIQQLQTNTVESVDSSSENENPSSSFGSNGGGDEQEWRECEFLPNLALNQVPDIVVALPAFDPNMPLNNMADGRASVEEFHSWSISPNMAEPDAHNEEAFDGGYSCWQNLPEFEDIPYSDNQEFLWSLQYPSMMELLECDDSRVWFDQQYTMVS